MPLWGVGGAARRTFPTLVGKPLVTQKNRSWLDFACFRGPRSEISVCTRVAIGAAPLRLGVNTDVGDFPQKKPPSRRGWAVSGL